ncbi:unnamed protein product [Oppiella nova]|uniref:Uncharacterized protein n=1 Tax=Oppiella nova TaxID=334625 RepID=A0A7R9M9L3_9ACAR|nr:unnamed protein product [Oppiella nova]CAG2173299.1 unnamed protein product [Oppiella nova]
MILSITLLNPFEMIDTFDELQMRPYLKVYVQLPRTNFKELLETASPIEQSILTRPGTINSDAVTFDNIFKIISDVRDRRTHVLMGTNGHISLLSTYATVKGTNATVKGKRVHIMQQKAGAQRINCCKGYAIEYDGYYSGYHGDHTQGK